MEERGRADFIFPRFMSKLVFLKMCDLLSFASYCMHESKIIYCVIYLLGPHKGHPQIYKGHQTTPRNIIPPQGVAND